MTPLRTLVTGLALSLFAIGSCRRFDLCDSGKCAEVQLAGAGATASGGGPTLSSGGAAAPLAGNGVGGESPADAGATGNFGAAGAVSEPLQCEAGAADCDHSRLTVCETRPSWNVRHCGACGISCEDGCYASKCLRSLLLTRDSGVGSFVSTKTFAFATISSQDDTGAFVRVRVDSGATDVLMENVSPGSNVALGDRVYVFDPDRAEIRSTTFDGSDARVEIATRPRSMGAYARGTYYIGVITDADGNYRYPLYYRPNATVPWKELRADVPGSFVSSSDYGVVYSEPAEDDEVEQLHLLEKDRLIPYGPAPRGMQDALATPSGITVLSYDDATSVAELWWLKADSTSTRYVLPPQSVSPHMRPYREVVAVSLVEGKSAYVQTFGTGGPDLGDQIGVRLGSKLLGLDNRYLWHLVTDHWFHLRFLRTEVDLLGL